MRALPHLSAWTDLHPVEHGPAFVLATLLAAAAAALATTPITPGRPPAVETERTTGRPGVSGASPENTDAGGVADPDPVGRHRILVSVLAGAAPVLLVGAWFGAVAGVAVALVVHRSLGRREPARDRRRRQEILRSLPQVVDLLAVSLAAGAAPSAAVTSVAAAVQGAVVDELRTVERSLALGRDPVRVWQEVGRRPGLDPLGRTMARAIETGASVSDALHRLAEDLQSSARVEAESRARTIGVRAAAPLGLCLLPAFVLIGVVPLVAGMLTALLAR